jgi:MFS family permease
MSASSLTMTWRRSSAAYVTFLLTVTNIFNYIDRASLAVLVQPIKHDLGLSDSQMGFLSGFAFVAVYAAIGIPLARLADRVGRRWVLAACVGFWGLMCSSCALARSFYQLAGARMGVGVGEGGCLPLSHALLAQTYAPGRRAVPIAIVTAGSAVGIALGLAGGGLIAAQFGWRTAFMVMGLPGLLLAGVVAWS